MNQIQAPMAPSHIPSSKPLFAPPPPLGNLLNLAPGEFDGFIDPAEMFSKTPVAALVLEPDRGHKFSVDFVHINRNHRVLMNQADHINFRPLTWCWRWFLHWPLYRLLKVKTCLWKMSLKYSSGLGERPSTAARSVWNES